MGSALVAGQIPPPPPGFQVVGGSTSAPAPARSARQQRRTPQQIRFPNDRDALIRTVIGEAGSESADGQNAVASVVLNRSRTRNLTPSQVVLERNQFEPWGNPETTQRLLAIQPNDPRYIQASSAVERALAGNDPTQGASHFYSPTAQAAMGRRPPSWDDGSGVDLGRHRFFRIEGQDSAPAQTAQRTSMVAPAPPPGFQIVGDAPEAYQASGNVFGLAEVAKKPWLGRQPVDFIQPEAQTIGADGVPEVNVNVGIDELPNGGARIPEMLADGSFAIYELSPEEFNTYRDQNGIAREKRAERLERQQSPEYRSDYAESKARIENVNPLALNLLQGGILGGADELLAMADSGQATGDAVRDRFAQLANKDPVGTFGAQLAGGFLTPGLKGSGEFISAGKGADRIARGSLVGAGYGVASGALNGEGNLAERLPDATMGGLTGFGGGAVGQGVTDRLFRGATNPSTGSAARRLSRQGVDLTPGQMLSEVPVVGSSAKYAEDIIGGFNPMMGGVRRSQNEQVIRAAGNEALSSLANSGPSVVLPKAARTGYQVSQQVQRALGSAYDDAIDRIDSLGGAIADQGFGQEISDMVTRAGSVLDDSSLGRLDRILESGVTNRFGPNGELSGQAFKDIEQSLRIARDKLDPPRGGNASLEATETAEFVDEAREAVRNLIARQYPDEAQRIRDINLGYANYKRIERAVSGSAQMAREGTPTPGELTQTVGQMSSNGQIANQTGLLQGLASDARTVLPASIGDTGSGQRAVIGGALGVAGTTGVAAISPPLAAAIAAGAVVYSKPGIAALNALYRATDLQTASPILGELSRIAQRNPALLPYYEAAAQHVQRLGNTDTQATQPAPQSAPVPTLVR